MFKFKYNLLKLFEKRRARLNYRIKRDYVRNGIAAINCKISGYILIVTVSKAVKL